jgi:hypothetical protein
MSTIRLYDYSSAAKESPLDMGSLVNYYAIADYGFFNRDAFFDEHAIANHARFNRGTCAHCGSANSRTGENDGAL